MFDRIAEMLSGSTGVDDRAEDDAASGRGGAGSAGEAATVEDRAETAETDGGPSAAATTVDGRTAAATGGSCTVEFHTQSPSVARTTPPVPTEAPGWFETTPHRVTATEQADGPLTIRSWPMVHQAFDSSITVPLWCELNVDLEPNEVNVHTPAGAFGVRIVDRGEIGDLADVLARGGYRRQVIQLDCPWAVRSPEGVACRIGDVPYNYDSPFRVLEGEFNSSYYNTIPTYVAIKDRPGGHEYRFSKGEPLFSVTPVGRVEPEVEVISRDDEFWEEYERTFPNVKSRFSPSKAYWDRDPLHDDDEPYPWAAAPAVDEARDDDEAIERPEGGVHDR